MCIQKNLSMLQEIVGPFSEISVMKRRKSHAFDSVKRLLTVLCKSNADTCLQNLPKFLAFLQILDHYKILTAFL